QVAFGIGDRGGYAVHLELAAAFETGRERPRRGRPVLVHDDDLRVPDGERRSVGQHEQLDERNKQQLREGGPVAHDLEKLLPDEKPDGAHGQASRTARRRMPTVSSAAVMAARMSVSCQRSASVAPLSITPRTMTTNHRAGTTFEITCSGQGRAL